MAEDKINLTEWLARFSTHSQSAGREQRSQSERERHPDYTERLEQQKRDLREERWRGRER